MHERLLCGLPPGSRPWNANIHYDRRLAELVPTGSRVLDVGCGDGFLSARLAEAGCEVVGLDADAGVLQRARKRWPAAGVEWVHGDVLTHPLGPGQFDAVVSNAALHHLSNTAQALGRLADLVRPGGVVGVVAFARNGTADAPLSLVRSIGIFVAARVRGQWEHTAPIHWPPALTYRQTRSAARRTLPGCRFRRLGLGRYLLTWTKPAPNPAPNRCGQPHRPTQAIAALPARGFE